MRIHALTGDGNTYRLVLHIPIPVANNPVGISYRTALVNSGLGGSSTMAEGTGPGQIATAELTQIRAGQVYEVVETVNLTGMVVAGLAAYADALYTQRAAEVLSGLQKALRYFGATRA